MLKPVLTAACLCGASLATAAQSPSDLSGQQIRELIAGATIEVDTPIGTRLPLSYTRDGKVTGDAGSLAWYLGSATDTGRWWIAGNQLCHQWKSWFSGETKCLRLSRQGRAFQWHSKEGDTGTARISVPAPVVAMAAAPVTVPKPERPPQAAAAAPVPETVASASAAEGALPAGAASEPAVPAPLPIAPEPQPAARPAPPTATKSAGSAAPAIAEPEPRPSAPARPLFKVTNVRDDDVLNVRDGPSSDFAIVGELRPGSRGITIVSECSERWCRVKHGTISGWVHSAYLMPEVMPAALPSPTAAPPPGVHDSPDAPRSCLTPDVLELLGRIEWTFGPVEVVSTCRPGALIPGTMHPSRHASGNAVDFRAGNRKTAILEWLIVNHRAGGIMTYAHMDHIHVDIGPRFVSIAGGPHWSSWGRGQAYAGPLRQ